MTEQLANDLRPLPLGVQSFERLRGGGYLYIDKTAQLLALIQRGARYFLSRPRRFGKSLMLSTLKAMFSGRAELFEGLAAEGWVAEQAEHPSPVLRIDMSSMDASAPEQLNQSLLSAIGAAAGEAGLSLSSDLPGSAFHELVSKLHQVGGLVTVLIDEYDRPILDHIDDAEAAADVRAALRGFYSVVKSCDEYLRFVMLTGISKFTKLGVFSAMNNLQDISMDRRWGALLGCTQAEVEDNFGPWLDAAREELNTPRADLLASLKKNYDGFCFDGATSLYNPFSILNFFEKREWGSYWFDSGVPNFIAQYAREHEVGSVDSYSGCELSVGELNRVAIEAMDERGLLYQAGILTIREIRRDEPMDPILVLDYPNEEVRIAFSQLWVSQVYGVKREPVARLLRQSLREGDAEGIVGAFNSLLAQLGPLEHVVMAREGNYHGVFVALLASCGVDWRSEVESSMGRADLVMLSRSDIFVIELKVAADAGEVPAKLEEAERQMEDRRYGERYALNGRAIHLVAMVIQADERRITRFSVKNAG